MYLEVFADNPYATNCWLLSSEGGDEALVVDPGFEPGRVRRLLDAAGKRPVAALATHGHHDHIGSAREFCGAEIPLYIHKDDELALTDPVAWGSLSPGSGGRPEEVRTVSDGDILEVAGFEVEVIHTPGHTPGSVCFRTEGLVFSGDLVFRGSVGRSDFPNSDPEAMTASLRRFLLLPDELEVYPGHLEPTTVAVERVTNPFLQRLA